jgi:hypothetical protein
MDVDASLRDDLPNSLFIILPIAIKSERDMKQNKDTTFGNV